MTVRVGDPELVLDPYDYDFHEDPYPYYRRLRDEAPLYRNEERNFWAVSRHHDVLQGFRDSTALSNAYGVSLDPSSRTSEAYRVMSMLAMDDPAHLRMRTLVSKGFTPRRIRELEPQVLELARIHLDSALQTESFDFVAEFAGKLPMDVISELIGVPDTDRARIRALADAVLHREDGVADVPPPAMAASIELMRYYADLIAEFRRRPANNLTSALLAAELDGDRLSDQEIMAFLFLMVIAGNETTTKLLANAVYWAAHHPGQLAAYSPTTPGFRCGWRKPCATTRPARFWPAPSRTISRCTTPRSPRVRCCCCYRDRPTVTTGCSTTRTTIASAAKSAAN